MYISVGTYVHACLFVCLSLFHTLRCFFVHSFFSAASSTSFCLDLNPPVQDLVFNETNTLWLTPSFSYSNFHGSLPANLCSKY